MNENENGLVINFAKSDIAKVKAGLTSSSRAKLEEARADALRRACEICSVGVTENGKTEKAWDLGRGLALLLHSDRDLMDEVSYYDEARLQRLHKQAKGSYSSAVLSPMRRQFERLSVLDKDGNDAYSRRLRALDADVDSGNDDLADELVENTILKRLEMESELMSYFRIKSTAGNKTAKFPLSSNRAKAQYATKTGGLVDISSTVETGIDSIVLEAEKFGAVMFEEAEFAVKLNAQLVLEVLDELSIAYRRGLHDQFVNGNGTAPNADGLATSATPFPFTGDITQTIIGMIASITDANRGANGFGDIFLLTNMAGGIAIEASKFLSQQHNQLIEALAAQNTFLKSINFVYDDAAVLTSGSSPTKSVPLYAGIKGHYLVAEASAPQVLVNPYQTFESGVTGTRIMAFHTGKPAFDDSFAKTTIPNVY